MRGEISSQLQSSLQEFRNLEVKSLIEYPPVVSDTDATISKIIGILKERMFMIYSFIWRERL
jgi:hypothetical protein